MRAALAALALLAAGLVLGASAPAPADGPDLARLMADDPAPTLADYRLFADLGGHQPNGARLRPYDLATPLFSDYALKRRFLYLPPNAKAAYRAEGVFDFPVGSVLIKTFAYPADFRRPDQAVRLVETRLLIHRAEGWVPLTYVWNAEQTQAVLKRAGTRVPVAFVDAAGQARQIDYQVPNTNQCKQCHERSEAVTPIGPKARNLNLDVAHDGKPSNQIALWSHLGLLTDAPEVGALPRLPRWDDPAEPLAGRARAYLDVNCGHCHNRAGMASNSGLYLTWEESDPTALGVHKPPVAAGRGSGGLEVSIEPGDPDRSILAWRMASTEPGVMMPQIGRGLVHAEGLALVRAYIAGMAR